MKLLAPIAAVIAAASASQIYAGQSAESYANSAELYQSAVENQQHGLYSAHSQAPQTYATHESTYNSRPAGEKIAKILSYKLEDNGHQYQYSYETENGIHTQENGKTAQHGTATHGAYSYTGDDGKVYTVTYTADENGFHPQGDHLPTPPPIPEEILKGLQQNARDEASGIYDDGKYHRELGHSSSYGSSHGASNGYQQYNGRYQNLGNQASSGHEAAAELVYHSQAGQDSGALTYHGQAGQDSGSLAYHGQAGQDYYGQASRPELAYRGQGGHISGASLAYRGHSSQASGANSAYLGQGAGSELAYRGHGGQSSGARLAYRGHANQASGANSAYPSQGSGSDLAYRGQARAKLAYRSQAGPKLAYRVQASGAENAYNSLSSQAGDASGTGLGYQGYSGNGGQGSLGQIVVLSSEDHASGNDHAEQGYAKH